MKTLGDLPLLILPQQPRLLVRKTKNFPARGGMSSWFVMQIRLYGDCDRHRNRPAGSKHWAAGRVMASWQVENDPKPAFAREIFEPC